MASVTPMPASEAPDVPYLSAIYRVGAFALSVLAVIAVSAAAWFLELNLASASLIQLLVIVVLSRQVGIWPASVASVTAVGCLNYLFITPMFTFTVADPHNWVALVVFESCALFVSRLSTKAHTQAMIAEKERRDTQRLYEVSQLMLLINRESAPGAQIVNLIARIFEPQAVILFDSQLARIDPMGDVSTEMEEEVRSTYFRDRDSYDAVSTKWYRVLRLGSLPMGTLAVRSPELTAPVVNALASLVAVALERARAFEAESRALAGRDVEKLRAAVLDALAHEVKTPLTAIITATGGLLEDATLSALQRDLLSLIDEQAGQLKSLTTRLLKTAKMDSTEVKLQRHVLCLKEITSDMVAMVGDRVSEHQIIFDVRDPEACTNADRDLLSLALSQLVDNAANYSMPRSTITVGGSATDGEVQVYVRNTGSAIPQDSRQRIFDRFYRLPGSEHRASGSGIGLSVAKKIVDAHHGRIWVADDSDATVFWVGLPRVPRSEI